MRTTDWMTPATAAARLDRQYQGWNVRTAPGRNGLRIMAVRDGLGPGLCAIVGDPDEVRAVLEADRRGTVRAAS